MNLEEEINKILNIRKKVDKDFQLSKNEEELLMFLEDNEESENIYKLGYQETSLKDFFLNNYLKKDIFEYRKLLLTLSCNSNEFYQILENSNLDYLKDDIRVSGLFKSNGDNDMDFRIYINPTDSLDYEEIKRRIDIVPKNLIGIVNSKISNDGKYYYGTPIIYKKQK